MKKAFFVALMLVTLNSCSFLKEKAEEGATGKILSRHIDNPTNYNKIDSNFATVNLEVNGERVFSKDIAFKGMMNAYRDNLVFQINDEAYKARIMLNLQGENIYAKKPVSGYTKPGESEDNIIVGTLMISKALNQTNTLSYLFHEGEIAVKKMAKDKVVIELNGSVGDIKSITNGKSLKNISGTIILNKPTMTGVEVDLENIMY